MKMLSCAAIGLGIFCLLTAVVEKFVGTNLFQVAPPNYVGLASSAFLLAVALMCHSRFYGPGSAPK